MTRLLLTGATGFVGQAVLKRVLSETDFDVIAATRGKGVVRSGRVRPFVIHDLNGSVRWEDGLAGVQAVIHAAARVHVMNETSTQPLADFRRVIVDGTLNLARQAAEAGVRRFVFLSSIKVNGEETAPGRAFTADDVPAPVDPYGVAKLEAEQGLRAIAQRTEMEVVIIRPVVVYGPGVKANFLSMMRWLDRGVPLPFGAVRNQRSFVALDNLVHLIVTCLDHSAAANQVFLVSDGQDLSTTELLRYMGEALGRPARLIPVSPWVLEGAARVLGKRSVSRRLCGSLQVDITKTRQLLGWSPPVGIMDALSQTAADFRRRRDDAVGA